MNTQPGANRLAVIDTDSGFIRVLTKRLEVAGWQHRVLSTPVAPEELVAMKLNAIVIDTAVLGTDAWDYLERVCGMLPELGVVVCTGQSTVAQRVRGLRLGADDWVGKPCHPEEVIARLEAVVRRRRRLERRPRTREQLFQPWLVEADNNGIIDSDDRDAHLPRPVDHLLGGAWIT